MRNLALTAILVAMASLPSVARGQRFSPPVFRPPVFRPPAPHFMPHPVVHPQGGRSDDTTWIWIVGGGLVVVAVIVAVVVIRKRNRVFRIRIVGTPPGEAPEAVRGAWIGLELPLAPGETGLRPLQQFEVVSLQAVGAERGYLVDGRQAVELLAAHHPEAAAWWRSNCAEALAARGQLAFPPEVCEKVGR
jgi:hypothetical protein